MVDQWSKLTQAALAGLKEYFHYFFSSCLKPLVFKWKLKNFSRMKLLTFEYLQLGRFSGSVNVSIFSNSFSWKSWTMSSRKSIYSTALCRISAFVVIWFLFGRRTFKFAKCLFKAFILSLSRLFFWILLRCIRLLSAIFEQKLPFTCLFCLCSCRYLAWDINLRSHHWTVWVKWYLNLF